MPQTFEPAYMERMMETRSHFKISLFFLLLLCGTLVSCEQDEAVVSVEGITLSHDMLLMGVGETATLTATLLPENATNRQVFWESADENVVTVSTEGVLEACEAGQTTVTATTHDGGFTASCTVYVAQKLPEDDPADKEKRTVLVYIAGDNNLASFAKQDMEEMKEGMASVVSGSLHLLVYADLGGDDAKLVEISSQDGVTVEKTIKEYGARNSTGVAETLEVFGDVFSNPDYQSESYGLVYWSHCDGWIPYPVPSTRWIGQDTGDGDNRMNLSDFVQILQYAPHFDFIMFDACFMQSVEVAYALRHYTDYYVASPTETPGPGAPYDRILPYMFIQGAAVEIARTYYEVYEEKYAAGEGLSNSNWTAGASICAVKTDGLEALASATRQLLPEEPVEVSSLQEVFSYDRRSSLSKVGYYDYVEMMSLLLPEDDFEVWKQAFDAVVAYWGTTPMNYSSSGGLFSMEGTCGVSHYIPASVTSEAAEAYRSTEWYEAAGLSRLGW